MNAPDSSGVPWEGEAPAEPLSMWLPIRREERGSAVRRSGSPSRQARSLPPERPLTDQPRTERALPSGRKHPVHGVPLTLEGPTIVLLTVCTKGRQRWLASELIHELLRTVWRDSGAWSVGKYVIMPDHIHLFVAPGERSIPLERWVRYWKSLFSKDHKDPSHRWQTDHWDTRLRCGEDYLKKWEYVRNNPVRHQLVERAEDWPFQGQIHEFRW